MIRTLTQTSSQFKGRLRSCKSKTMSHLQRVFFQACIPNRKLTPGKDNLGGTKLYLIYLSAGSRQQLGSYIPLKVPENFCFKASKSGTSQSFIHIKRNFCIIQLGKMKVQYVFMYIYIYLIFMYINSRWKWESSDSRGIDADREARPLTSKVFFFLPRSR